MVNRVICHLLCRRIHGNCDMHGVDDLTSACSLSEFEHNLLTAYTLCESLLGPASVERCKTEHGRRVRRPYSLGI